MADKLKVGQIINHIFETTDNNKEVIASYLVLKVQWVDLKLYCLFSKHVPESRGDIVTQGIKHMSFNKQQSTNEFYWDIG